MQLSDTAAASVVAALASCISLKTLKLPWKRNSSLTALPDLAALTDLKDVNLPNHLTPWKAGGFKAWDFITDGWPLDSTDIDMSFYGGATIGEWLSRCTSVQALNLRECRSLTALPNLSALKTLKTLNLMSCSSLTALPDLSALTSLQTLYLDGCESLTTLPDLSALTSLQKLILWGCSSLTALPDLSSLAGLKVEGLPQHLQAWEDGGRKSFSVPIKFQPGARVRLTGLTDEQAHLNGRGGTVVRASMRAFPANIAYVVTFDQALRDGGEREIWIPEGYLEPEPP